MSSAATRLEKFKAHYQANGLGAAFATSLIR